MKQRWQRAQRETVRRQHNVGPLPFKSQPTGDEGCRSAHPHVLLGDRKVQLGPEHHWPSSLPREFSKVLKSQALLSSSAKGQHAAGVVPQMCPGEDSHISPSLEAAYSKQKSRKDGLCNLQMSYSLTIICTIYSDCILQPNLR